MDNTAVALAQALEMALAVPGAFMAFAPVRNHLRMPLQRVVPLCAVCLVILISTGVSLCAYTGWSSMAALIPGTLVLFAPYSLLVALPLAKSAFCYANAALLCALVRFFGIALVAPWEANNSSGALLPQSAAATLGVAIVLGLLFARTLLTKLPALMESAAIAEFWRVFAPAVLLLAVGMGWMVPWHPELLLIGRSRPIVLAFAGFIACVIWTFYHVAWRVMTRVQQEGELHQELTLLRMEERRLKDVQGYVGHTRALRHDFRHHLLVMRGLLDAHKTNELDAYLHQLTNAEEESRIPQLCANAAVDAMAARYDAIARERGVTVAWRLELPSELPVAEVDLCAALGNLVENAIEASAELDEGARRVEVVAQEVTAGALGLTVRNACAGNVRFGRDGLPEAKRPGHGVGLASVKSIAERYGGALDVHLEGGDFCAGVLLFHG